MRPPHRPSDRSDGQVIVLFALSLVVIILAVGLVIDGGTALSQRRASQNASDFAALGGARIVAEWMSGDTTNGTDTNVEGADQGGHRGERGEPHCLRRAGRAAVRGHRRPGDRLRRQRRSPPARSASRSSRADLDSRTSCGSSGRRRCRQPPMRRPRAACGRRASRRRLSGRDRPGVLQRPEHLRR